MEKIEKEEIQEIQEKQSPQVQRPFRLKPDSRIELVAEEIAFLINTAQAFTPFLQYARGIEQIAAFGQYLSEKMVKSSQVEFLDQPEAPKSLIEVVERNIKEPDISDVKESTEYQDLEADVHEEKPKMGVAYKSPVQEELASQ